MQFFPRPVELCPRPCVSSGRSHTRKCLPRTLCTIFVRPESFANCQTFKVWYLFKCWNTNSVFTVSLSTFFASGPSGTGGLQKLESKRMERLRLDRSGGLAIFWVFSSLQRTSRSIFNVFRFFIGLLRRTARSLSLRLASSPGFAGRGFIFHLFINILINHGRIDHFRPVSFTGALFWFAVFRFFPWRLWWVRCFLLSHSLSREPGRQVAMPFSWPRSS